MGETGEPAFLCDASISKNVCEAGMGQVPDMVVVDDEEIASKNLIVTVQKKSQSNR